MARSARRWFLVALSGLVLLLGGMPVGTARAGSSIRCAMATPAASSTAATASQSTPVAADPVAFPDGGGDLTVFAASSLTDAFTEIKATLEAAHPGLTITLNFAGSQVLVTQLKEGARADVLATASSPTMSLAVDNGNIAGTPETFATNILTVVVPRANPGGVVAASDLAKPGLRLVLAAEAVPAGKYARQAICKLGGAGSEQAFADKVAANVVSEEEDVRDVLTKVGLGEADAGIVYVSDALAHGDAVASVEIPAAANVVATYPVAAVAGSGEPLARAFIAYLLSPEGQETLARWGFRAAS